MGPLGELGALFNPGMRHEIEERQSKENRREEEGNARDGDLRIDLASGVAVINLPGKPDHADRSSNADLARTDHADQTDTASGSPSDRTAMAASRDAAAQRRAAARTQRKHSPQDSGAKTKAADVEKPRPAQVPSSKASRAAR